MKLYFMRQIAAWVFMLCQFGLHVTAMAMLTTGAVFAGDQPGSPDLQMTNESDAGLYSVTAWPETGSVQVGEMHRWIVRVLTSEGIAVYPVRMSIGGGMKSHGHGLPTQPQVVAYGGDGEYLVDGVRFNMAGAWRLSFLIDSEFGSDRVDFEFEIRF